MSTPTLVQTLLDEDIVQINSSGDVSAAVTANGQVYTWGRTKVISSSFSKCYCIYRLDH